ncbi:MAG TPA: hypothetical protein VFU93_10325 [Acidimicrobiales bacterium]|nr:hypothetical protein [Acidimicrobiales bacterium]
MRRVLGGSVVLGLLAFIGLFVAGPLGTPACAAQPAPLRVGMRILLVSIDGTDSGIAAWRDLLLDEGVPHDELHLDREEIEERSLWDGDMARFQAIVLADSHLSRDGRPDLPSLLDPAERQAISEYQTRTGARLVAATIVPDPALPLTLASTPSDLDGFTGELTAAGREVFPYLRGSVPIEDAFGFVPTADVTPDLTPLVELPSGQPLVVVATGATGNETLYVAPQVSQPVLHWRLLRHGLLGWATGGVHLGLRQLHYAMQVDDVFLPNFRWDPVRNQTTQRLGTSQMSPEDVDFAAQWSTENDLRLDIAYNAAGRTEEMCEAVLAEKAAFGWVSHTYTHRDLDEVSEEDLVEEITLNRRWAQNHDLPGFRDDELVTGAHTGLENPNMPAALRQTGIRWIASDASKEPAQRPLGDALTVPRYPTDIYYDASTREEQVDEYNFTYLQSCDPAVTRCRDEPADWDAFVEIQSELMFRHILDGDPRIHYAHQSNMTDDRTIYEPLEHMLERYRDLIVAPLLQPTLADSGEELRRFAVWSAAVADGAVEGWLEDGRVHVRSSVELEVPVTGADVGAVYAGERVAWVRVAAGGELVLDG